MTKKLNLSKSQISGVIVLSAALAIFVAFLTAYLSIKTEQRRLQNQIDKAQEELRTAFTESQKLDDDEYYLLYDCDEDEIITSGDKIIIKFGK